MTQEELEKLAQERIARVKQGADLLKRNTVLMSLVKHVSESFLGFHCETKSKAEVKADIEALRKSNLFLSYETEYRCGPKTRCIKLSLGINDMDVYFYVSEPNDQWV